MHTLTQTHVCGSYRKRGKEKERGEEKDEDEDRSVGNLIGAPLPE